MTRPLTLFCSNGYFLPHILHLYEEAKALGRRVGIIVPVNEAPYRYLRELSLDTDYLHFFPDYSGSQWRLRTPHLIIAHRLYYSRMLQQLNKALTNCDIIYQGSMNAGPNSAAVGYAVRHGCRVYNHGWNPHALRFHPDASLRLKVRRFIYQWIVQCPLRYGSVPNLPQYANLLLNDEEALGVTSAHLPEEIHTADRFLYRPVRKTNPRKTILLMDGHDETYYRCYENTMRRVIGALKSAGWSILLKSHPRLGSASFFDGIIDAKIPDYVPVQMLDCNCFAVVVGNLSSGMTALASRGIPVFSLEYIQHRRDVHEQKYFIAPFAKQSAEAVDNRFVRFPSSLSSLLSSLRGF
jgi:hypothetical protein